jgi:hypothetical protein
MGAAISKREEKVMLILRLRASIIICPFSLSDIIESSELKEVVLLQFFQRFL